MLPMPCGSRRRWAPAFEGRAAIRGFAEDWMGAYEEWHAAPEELFDLGSGVVFAVVRQSGRPVGTGIEVELHPLHVFRLRDGKAVRWQVFLDRTNALEAAGLEE